MASYKQDDLDKDLKQLQKLIQGGLKQKKLLQGGLKQKKLLQGGLKQKKLIQGGEKQKKLIQGGEKQKKLIQGGEKQKKLFQGGEKQKKLFQGGEEGEKLLQGGEEGEKLVQGGSKKKKVVKKMKKTMKKDKKSTKKTMKRTMKKRTMKKRTMKGGAEEKVRHFKVVDVNGKKVDFGAIKISIKRTPLSAARKAFTSIMEHMNVKKANRAGFKATFSIYETTRGSKNKVYGPYHGRYHKYTEEEKKKAKAGKQTFEGKPVVRLIKGHNKREREMHKREQKGGR